MAKNKVAPFFPDTVYIPTPTGQLIKIQQQLLFTKDKKQYT